MTTPGQSPDRLPAIAALGAEFSRLAHEEQLNPRFGRSIRRAPRPAVALTVLAALVVAAVTPPGQAVAERIGELIGVVDDDGAVVVDTGTTPREAHPYTVAATGEPRPGETCIFLRFQEIEDGGYGSCLATAVPGDLARENLSPFIYPAPEGLLSNGSAVLQGLATPDVARVEVTFDNDGVEQAVPVDISDLDSELLRRIPATDEPVRFFVAFLPPEALDGATIDRSGVSIPDVQISAFEASGDLLNTRSLADLRDYETGLEDPAY